MKRRLYVEVVLMDMVISAFERRLYVVVVFKDMVISASVQRIGSLISRRSTPEIAMLGKDNFSVYNYRPKWGLVFTR